MTIHLLDMMRHDVRIARWPTREFNLEHLKYYLSKKFNSDGVILQYLKSYAVIQIWVRTVLIDVVTSFSLIHILFVTNSVQL